MANPILLENRLSKLIATYNNLNTELSEVHQLLITVGFPEGLKSLKEIAEEMILTKSLSDFLEEDESA